MSTIAIENLTKLRDMFRAGTEPHELAVEALAALEPAPATKPSAPVKRKSKD